MVGVFLTHTYRLATRQPSWRQLFLNERYSGSSTPTIACKNGGTTMNLGDLKAFRDSILADNVLFCYSGPISQGLIEEVGQTVRTNMSAHAESRTVIERIFGIFVEQVQNIMNYSAEEYDSMRSGIVVVGREAKTFFVVCGNTVDDASRRKIECAIDEISGKDKKALKDLYKRKMKQADLQEGKGAGLGLIDIARKSSEPVEYRFDRDNAGNCFFASKVTISEKY